MSVAIRVIVATIVLGAGLALCYFIATTGLGGLVRCGMWDLNCGAGALVLLPIGPAIATPLLWQAASKADRSELSWFWVRFYAWLVTAVLVLLVLSLLLAAILIAGR